MVNHLCILQRPRTQVLGLVPLSPIMMQHQKHRQETKHDQTHADWLSTIKPSISLKRNPAQNRLRESNKVSSTQEMRLITGRLSAIDEFDFLGIKTTDLDGKQRNWAMMEFEAAQARARNIALARKRQAPPTTAPKQPIEVHSRPMEIKWRLPEEGHYQKYTTWRKPEKKLSSQKLYSQKLSFQKLSFQKLSSQVLSFHTPSFQELCSRVLSVQRPSPLRLPSRRLSPARFSPPVTRPAKVEDEDLQNPKECLYFSLPGEIRNMIMGNLIGPRNVLITSDDQPSHGNSDVTLHASGWQFLATCQQANTEGCKLYSENEFHLAPGPLWVSINGLKDMNPRFQGLVKNITMNLSILDLTPAVLDRIEKMFFPEFCKMTNRGNYMQMAYYVRNALLDLWLEKIARVRDAQTIDRFKLVSMHFCESDGADDRYTQWPSLILTVHRHQNLDRIEGLHPSFGLDWGRASRLDDLYLGPRGKDIPNYNTRMMLFVMLVHIQHVITTRLRDGISLSGGGLGGSWTAFKLWLKSLQISTKEYTWEGTFFDRNGFRVRRYDWK